MLIFFQFPGREGPEQMVHKFSVHLRDSSSAQSERSLVCETDAVHPLLIPAAHGRSRGQDFVKTLTITSGPIKQPFATTARIPCAAVQGSQISQPPLKINRRSVKYTVEKMTGRKGIDEVVDSYYSEDSC